MCLHQTLYTQIRLVMSFHCTMLSTCYRNLVPTCLLHFLIASLVLDAVQPLCHVSCSEYLYTSRPLRYARWF